MYKDMPFISFSDTMMHDYSIRQCFKMIDELVNGQIYRRQAKVAFELLNYLTEGRNRSLLVKLWKWFDCDEERYPQRNACICELMLKIEEQVNRG